MIKKKSDQDAILKKKIMGIGIGISCIGLLIIVRLFDLQIIRTKSFSLLADRQYVSSDSHIFDRGQIFFTDKDGSTSVAAATNTGFKIAIYPKQILDTEATYSLLSGIIPLDKTLFMEAVSKKEDPYEEIAHYVSEENGKKIAEKKISGVYIYRERWRTYPGESLGARILGFVSFKGDDLVGRYGLERQYDDTLSRKQDAVYTNFFAEVFSGIHTRFKSEAHSEGSLVTTVDPHVLRILEDELKTVQKKYTTDFVGGIVMDPKTGEILAMSGMPDFDLNNFKEESNGRVFQNPSVEGSFEVGSVIKPLIVAAGLDARVITPETRYNDTGSVKVKNVTFHNFDKKGRGDISMQDVLIQSLNTGMVLIEQKLGKELFKKYVTNYELGKKTGIDLPGEVAGNIRNLEKNSDVDYAAMAFGQGIALTPIAITRAFASLGNGGYLPRPYIGKKIVTDTGLTESIVPVQEKKQVIRPDTSERITRMLVNVVDKGYGDGKYKMERYTVAGKTGTAQVARPDGKGYYDDKHMHSFFAYAPAFSPRFLIYIYAIDPKGARFASETVVSPTFNVLKYLLSYYNVPPDR